MRRGLALSAIDFRHIPVFLSSFQCMNHACSIRLAGQSAPVHICTCFAPTYHQHCLSAACVCFLPVLWGLTDLLLLLYVVTGIAILHAVTFLLHMCCCDYQYPGQLPTAFNPTQDGSLKMHSDCSQLILHALMKEALVAFCC